MRAGIAAPAVARAPVNVGDGGLSLLDQFSIAGSTGGYVDTGEFLQFIRNAESGVREPGLFEGRGPLAILLLVLLGGLALNLTPCVLPMIPINLAIIGAGAGNGSRTRGFLLGGVYGGAMALVYGLLGLIVILTAGTFDQRSPWFSGDSRHLRRAASMRPPRHRPVTLLRIDRHHTSKRGSFAIAFVWGSRGVVGEGRVAPVVIQVVVFSSDIARGTVALWHCRSCRRRPAVPWP